VRSSESRGSGNEEVKSFDSVQCDCGAITRFFFLRGRLTWLPSQKEGMMKVFNNPFEPQEICTWCGLDLRSVKEKIESAAKIVLRRGTALNGELTRMDQHGGDGT
jgi:hypothetical protein